MTIVREFLSNFIKVKRTPIVLLHLLLPVMVTTLFCIYYSFAGYHIIPDMRVFFILLQICYPIFVSIVVPILIQLDANASNMQNALGFAASRWSVYLGKLLFLLFLSTISIFTYEVCFYVGANMFLDIRTAHIDSYLSIFYIFIFSNLFLYLLHIPIAFRFGSGISVLFGISGTILAGLFENAIGDGIWPFIPWEWGVRFLETYFEFSDAPVFCGIISLLIIDLVLLVLSLLWFNRWEGNVIQE